MKTWIKILIAVGIFTFGFGIGIVADSGEQEIIIQEKIVNPTTGNPTIDFLMTPEGLCSNNEIILAAISLIKAQQEVIKIYVSYPFPEIDYNLQLEVHDWCIER